MSAYRIALAAVFTTILQLVCASTHAATVDYELTALNGTKWRYDYLVTNNFGAVPLQEITIDFNEQLFANLSGEAGPAGWSVVIAQPDQGLPASGFYDAAHLAGGIIPGGKSSGFSVTFDYLGAGTPGAQPFTIVDPVSFEVVYSGMTSLTSAVPEPSSAAMWLLVGLPACLLMRRRDQAVRRAA